MSYTPVVHKLPVPSKNIFESNPKPAFSSDIDYPKFSLGFHHFIHQSKDKMSVTDKFKGKKKVYHVISKFERSVDNHDADISNVSKAFFDLDPKPNILSRAFFKLWEIFFMFDIVPLDTSNFVSAHLAEGPGSFIQATMFYRDKFVKKPHTSKKDKYHAVTLHSEKSSVPPVEKSFLDYYKRENPVRFVQHQTVSKAQAGGSMDKDNGDLTDPKTMLHFGGAVKLDGMANLVTADGGFDWNNENIQEQEAFVLILAEIVMAVKIQAKGGSFVCKFFESFTDTSAKLLCVLSTFYNEVHLVKPLMSRQSNSEKYAVCTGFKFDSKSSTKDKYIAKLDQIVKEGHKNKKLGLRSMFPDFDVPRNYLKALTNCNVEIANRQFESINDIIKFIEAENYFGDEYQTRRKMQITATKFWLDTFYPDKLETNRKQVKELASSIATKNGSGV